MIPYLLNGVQFMAHDTECGAFHVFNPDRPESLDGASPVGMVAELRAFIKETEHLRHFVDIGALFGIFSLIFTRHIDAVAYAIEPSTWAWPLLLEHVAANPERRIIPIQKFIGEQSGLVVTCSRDWKHVCANTPPHPKGESTSCTVTRLDDIPEIERIDCMKIDVESYECAVLRGATRLIAKWRPIIFLECHLATLHFNGESPASLDGIIRGLGYKIEYFDGTEVKILGEPPNIHLSRVICRPL